MMEHLNAILPLHISWLAHNIIVHSYYIVVDGWDISKLSIGDAMVRAQVLEVGLQDQLYSKMSQFHPRPSIYDADFIAANQASRADNLMIGTKHDQYEQIRMDIRYIYIYTIFKL